METDTQQDGKVTQKGVNNRSQAKTNDILKRLIKMRYRTIQAFADELGVSRSRVSQIIHSHIEATNEMKIQMAEKLDVDSRFIWEDKK